MSMARCPTFLLLATLLCVHLGAHSTHGRFLSEFLQELVNESALKPYDKLVLVFHWAPAFCVKNSGCTISRTAPRTNWTIHGLWPFKSNTKPINGPMNCGGTYQDSLMHSIRSEMNQKWPSYQSGGTNEGFWKHEYVKHGTCAADIAKFNTQVKYFEETMKLYDKYDIYKILVSGNVAPSSSLVYPLNDITQALHNGLGVEPAVFCFDSKTKSTEQYLWEVRMCFDKSLNPITCGSALMGGGRCTALKSVVYEPFDGHVSSKSLSAASDYRDDLQWLFDVVEEMEMNEDDTVETMNFRG